MYIHLILCNGNAFMIRWSVPSDVGWTVGGTLSYYVVLFPAIFQCSISIISVLGLSRLAFGPSGEHLDFRPLGMSRAMSFFHV